MQKAFIVLDGPDGTGTTTHSLLLSKRLEAEGYSVLLTAEPTEGPIGRSIRTFLKGKEELDPSALQLLFCADRAWHLESIIEPALKKNNIVICDRYSSSTLVYAKAQGLEAPWLRAVNDAFLQPDLLFFTLPSHEVSMKRLETRSEKEIFETHDFQERIHEGYRTLGKENPLIQIIDTAQEKDQVAAVIYEKVKEMLAR